MRVQLTLIKLSTEGGSGHWPRNRPRLETLTPKAQNAVAISIFLASSSS